MNKTKLLNGSLSRVVAEMGHKQMLTIGDAGLPVPKETERIDLSVSAGIPSFLDVLDAVADELCIEKIYLAEEIKTENPRMEHEILRRFGSIPVEYMPHEKFKERTKESAAVVRTGETKPYSNIILVAGVTF